MKSSTPHIVLVHGAFADGSGWSRVIPLLEQDGYTGLAAGFTACRDILNTFWDNLFPEKARLRARAQALQWMADRVTPALQSRSSASRSVLAGGRRA